MTPASPAARRFVRLLGAAGRAGLGADGRYLAADGKTRCRLDRRAVRALVAQGVLAEAGDSVRQSPEAPAWLARQQAAGPAGAAADRNIILRTDGSRLDLSESPLARLAASGDAGPAFLEAHQVEAGEHVRRLAERARMIQRTTMSYDPARVASSAGRSRAGDASESALDARRRLATLLSGLPRDCAGVVLDVCGLLKGLQTVETERGWPARSAKIVLRIGLDHAARGLGLMSEARGPARSRQTGWIEERPMRFE